MVEEWKNYTDVLRWEERDRGPEGIGARRIVSLFYLKMAATRPP
jgi:hypothetical protein